MAGQMGPLDEIDLAALKVRQKFHRLRGKIGSH